MVAERIARGIAAIATAAAIAAAGTWAFGTAAARARADTLAKAAYESVK